MKLLLTAGAIAAVIALALLVGQRLPEDAMAVVVGVVVGIAASIPTSLVMLAMFGRRQEPRPEAPRPTPTTQVYVAPGARLVLPAPTGELEEWHEGRWN